jgi:hypothetical protein
VARKCIELLLYVVPWGVREWDLLLIVLVCRGVVAWVYLQGDEPVRYFCIYFFFSSNNVEYIQFYTSTFVMQFEATATKEFNRKICKKFQLVI